MMVGLPNLNVIPILTRMIIKNTVTGDEVTVLYNPESYKLSRSVNYSEKAGLNSDFPSIQFVSGGNETLEFDLFLDTFTASAEVGGSMLDKAKFTGNALLPSIGKQLDVRDYTKLIYNLMQKDGSVHVPPLVEITWNSLKFKGHLVSCSQDFIKFNELGMPVRAKMHCVFKRYLKPSEIAKLKPNESPDTAKYRKVNQGDSLWSMAAAEYGEPARWREIADANGMANPRIMNSGEMMKVPAL